MAIHLGGGGWGI